VRARDATGAGRGGAQETVKDERGIVGRYTRTGGTRRRAREGRRWEARGWHSAVSSVCAYMPSCVSIPPGALLPPVPPRMFMPHGIVSSIPSYAR